MKFALAAIIFSIAFGAIAQTTNALSAAEIQGRKLAKQLCEIQPTGSLTNNGILEIQNSNGNRSDVFLKIETILTRTNWLNHYQTYGENLGESNLIQKMLQTRFYQASNDYAAFSVTITHTVGMPNEYWFSAQRKSNGHSEQSFGNQTMVPFANSDFWICDLGLEFFNWPEQKVLRKEIRRSRGCTVLESMNPYPSANGYSRVVSWIDNETLGIVHAEAYDAKGKLLKIFNPKSFKKVNGQWELQEMEIRNVQTGSRTWLKLDLKS
jgi:Outer membrane lipoprotein-sorting protein